MPLPVTGELFGEVAASALGQWPPPSLELAPGWAGVVDGFLSSPAGLTLGRHLLSRLQLGAVVYPPHPLRALQLTPADGIRVVILGQDPYHGPGQAQGLAFSVPPTARVPPSLRNVLKEYQRDLGLPLPRNGCLQPWAERGALLLNTALTVEDGQPGSHTHIGWEALTDALIAKVVEAVPCCVYMLWGAHAQSKANLIQSHAVVCGHRALLLQANHPSPLSAARGPRPFVGCGHFSQAARWLAQQGINWHWGL